VSGKRGRVSHQQVRAALAAVLLAGVAAAPISTYADAIYGNDAVWLGLTGDWNRPANWLPASTPTGTAIFSESYTATIGFSQLDTEIGTIALTADAPEYRFLLRQPFITLDITGRGIIDYSVFRPVFGLLGNLTSIDFEDGSRAGDAVIGIFNHSASVAFSDWASAARAAIFNNGRLLFFDQSSAGRAVIANLNRVEFSDDATAARAAIANAGFVGFNDWSDAGRTAIANARSGSVDFSDRSSAGHAAIANTGFVGFNDRSTAGRAAIANARSGLVDFSGRSSAGHAIIANNGLVSFYDRSTAGSATIATGWSGLTAFYGHSTGGDAQLIIARGGALDISGLTARGMTAGSIAGAGTFYLGSKQLIVGGDNRSTTVNGTIVNGGLAGGRGGSLVKTGNGTLTLTGTNRYSGGTVIKGGVLQLGNGGTTGSIRGKIADDSILAIDRSNRVTLRSAISGSGQVLQLGVGTTVLAHKNTYSGGTVISAGTLAVSANDELGARSGGITFAGPGTLRLTSRFASDRAIDLVAGGTIDTGAHRATLGGIISGPGGLTKTGSGKLVLTGVDTYSGGTTIAVGTLQLGNGGTQGSIIGNVLDNGVFAVDRSDIFTYDGAISGTGGFVQNGAGETVLSGTSTFTGRTIVNAGTLEITGSLMSSVLVNSGGFLTGNGTIGGLNVASGGTVAPSGSIATLNVNGNVTFAPGSTFVVAINPAGPSDKITATGAATLSGGTVEVEPAPGSYTPQTRYTILSADGGVSGSFANVTSSLGILTPSLSGDPDDVFLTLTRNTYYFSDIAQTPNQLAVAGALDASPFASGLVQAVAPLSDPEALQAFDALSGEIHASVDTTMIDEASYLRDAILGRLRSAAYQNAAGPLASFATSGPAATFALAAPPGGGSLAASDAPGVLPAPGPSPVANPDVTFWTQGLGAWGRVVGNGNAAETTDTLGGFVAGADRRFGQNWRAGIAVGYAGSNLTIDERSSTAGINSTSLAAYGGGTIGPWSLRAGSAVSWNHLDTERAIGFPGLSDYATSDYGGQMGQVFGEAGYGLTVGSAAVEPYGGLAFVHLGAQGFTETAATAALSGTGNIESIGYSSLGVRAADTMQLANGMTLLPRAAVAWQHGFGNIVPTASLAFQSTGAAFSVAGVPLARDAALVEAGIDLVVSPRARLGLAYSGQLGGGVYDHAVEGTLTWQF
jgi:outer membrane autotransporter protein